MRQIIYTSRATGVMRPEAFGSLVHQAIAHNLRTGITGLLVFDGLRFLQVMEGPATEIEACMARVRMDPRHHDIAIALERDVDVQQFGTFAMASMRREPGRKQDFIRQIKAAVERVNMPEIQALFIGFAALS